MHNANRLNITALELMLQFCVDSTWKEKDDFIARQVQAQALYANGNFNASAGHIRQMVKEFPLLFEARYDGLFCIIV